MLQVCNTSTSTGGPVTIGPGPYLVNGSNGSQYSIFCPTAMDLTDSNGVANTVTNQAARTASTCYIKGFAEKIRIQTSSGLPWFWRRIVFRYRGGGFNIFLPSDTPTQTNGGFPTFTETSNGFQRLYFNLTINASNNTLAQHQDILFKGTVGKDWVDIQTALVDTTRVDLVSDRRMTIRSGNANGTVKDVNTYHRYNHNLVYNDDESGALEASSYFSTDSKQGNGDMYIVDIFTPGTGSAASDILQLTSTSTLYWHEK